MTNTYPKYIFIYPNIFKNKINDYNHKFFNKL